MNSMWPIRMQTIAVTLSITRCHSAIVSVKLRRTENKKLILAKLSNLEGYQGVRVRIMRLQAKVIVVGTEAGVSLIAQKMRTRAALRAIHTPMLDTTTSAGVRILHLRRDEVIESRRRFSAVIVPSTMKQLSALISEYRVGTNSMRTSGIGLPKMSALTIEEVMRAMSRIMGDTRVAAPNIMALRSITISKVIPTMVTDQEVSVQVNITINRPQTTAVVATSTIIALRHIIIITISNTDLLIRATTTTRVMIITTTTTVPVVTITIITIIGIAILASTITILAHKDSRNSREARIIVIGRTT